MQTGIARPAITLQAALVAGILAATVAACVLVARNVVVSPEAATEAPPQTSAAEEPADLGFVLDPRVAQVLHHRPGLRPIDVIRGHAFGWTGLTIHEVLSRPQYLRILRMDPSIAPIDLIREEARGS